MAGNTAQGANCFDASALVKIFTNEDGGEIVRDYFNNRSPTKYTTPFCFYETLSVLKVKWRYRNTLTHAEYDDAALSVIAWYEASSVGISDIDLVKPDTFSAVRSIAKRHSLDLSDAFQILSVKAGFYSGLCGDSRTILVTADKELAAAAQSEGIRVWYCLGTNTS